MKTPNPHYPSATPELMLARLQWIFSNPSLRSIAKMDLWKVLRAIGYGIVHAEHKAEQFIESTMKAKSLRTLERHWNKVFEPRLPDIQGRLTRRAEIVFNQVFPHICGPQGQEVDLSSLKLLDFGTGDGQIAEALSQSGISVIGIDVVKYLAPKVSIQFQKFDGCHAPFDDGSFDVVLATNVLHHEAENDHAEREIARLLKVGGKFVVIETVPVGFNPEAVALDFERTFVGDYFYNRILHAGKNIPVPGTYETVDGWRKRFGRWTTLVQEQDLGIDIPVIQDYHWLGVFKKN